MPDAVTCPDCKHSLPDEDCTCIDVKGYCPCHAHREALEGGRVCRFVCLDAACCYESCHHEAVYDGLCAAHLEQQEITRLFRQAVNYLLSLSEAHHPFARQLEKKAKAVTHYSTYAQLRRVVQQIRRKDGNTC